MTKHEQAYEVTEKSGKIRIEYSRGESKESMGLVAAGWSVDYMLARIPQEDDPKDIELYAEMPSIEDDETATYDELRVEIMRQAVERGVDLTRLEFWYDDQPSERLLSTTQTADILGISEIRIRQLCQEGKMGTKVGNTWVITPEDVERNRVRRGPGQPRKNELP